MQTSGGYNLNYILIKQQREDVEISEGLFHIIPDLIISVSIKNMGMWIIKLIVYIINECMGVGFATVSVRIIIKIFVGFIDLNRMELRLHFVVGQHN